MKVDAGLTKAGENYLCFSRKLPFWAWHIRFWEFWRGGEAYGPLKTKIDPGYFLNSRCPLALTCKDPTETLYKYSRSAHLARKGMHQRSITKKRCYWYRDCRIHCCVRTILRGSLAWRVIFIRKSTWPLNEKLVTSWTLVELAPGKIVGPQQW